MNLMLSVPTGEASQANIQLVAHSQVDTKEKKEVSLVLDEEMGRDEAKDFTSRLAAHFPVRPYPYNAPPAPAIKITRSELPGGRGARVRVCVHNTGDLDDETINNAICAAFNGGVTKSFSRYHHYAV